MRNERVGLISRFKGCGISRCGAGNNNKRSARVHKSSTNICRSLVKLWRHLPVSKEMLECRYGAIVRDTFVFPICGKFLSPSFFPCHSRYFLEFIEDINLQLVIIS